MRIGAALLTAGVVVVSVSCTLRGTVGVVDSEQTGLGTSGTGQDTNDEGEILDVAGTDGNICVDRGLINGEGDCEPAPISGDLQPALEWSWSGEGEDTDTLVIPLVINLTDDDGNGRVDLCDTPDVLVTAGPPAAAVPISDPRAHIYALDGATGSVHWVSEVLVRGTITPAVGDINGDGRVEVVTLAPATECDQVRPTPPQYYSQLVAIADDGSLHWRSPHCFGATQADAVALAHLQDGNRADIMVADRVFAANGAFRFAATVTGPDEDTPRVAPLFPFAIDLDGDSTTAPDLEVVWPHVVRDGDGTLLFEDMDERGGFIHAANFDGDPAPELVLASDAGLVLFDLTGGTPQERPMTMDASLEDWRRPLAIQDVNIGGGQGRVPEILATAEDQLLLIAVDVPNGQFTEVWSVTTEDGSGPQPNGLRPAAGTMFDFLDDLRPEAVHADESGLYIYATDALDPPQLFQAPRSSVVLHEYPVIVDVDNDGSAEILVGSNLGLGGERRPTLQVFGDPDAGWMQARRVWNQHNYRIANIDESGQLPVPEPNLFPREFRTNAKLVGGVICLPEP